MCKDIIEIQKDYFNGKYSPPKEAYVERKCYPENHVFDENLSVKRNREMVVEFNEENKRKRKEYNDLCNKMFRQMQDDVVEYIMNTYSFSKQRAEKIESFVYAAKHSCMCDYFSYIDEIAELVDTIIEMR